MSLILRIDVDRPYGRAPLWRHVASRLASDLPLPRLPALGYLRELEWMLGLLEREGGRALVFFRRCTAPGAGLRRRLAAGGHQACLHMEDTRSEAAFRAECARLSRRWEAPPLAASKHGSGGARFGHRHHPPYEPDRYLPWLERAGFRLFLGNGTSPSAPPVTRGALQFHPAAFWLEPPWRDTAFSLRWLRAESSRRDVVLLVHPENVRDSAALTRQFQHLIRHCPCSTPPQPPQEPVRPC